MNSQPQNQISADTSLQIPDCKLKAGLYIIATPIGNLADITLRAISVLKNADILLCEDTRVTAKLLGHYGIKISMIAYNDYNGAKTRPRIMRYLEDGKIVALVSDAGTPMISDPGYKLVNEVSAAGHYITTLPGASCVLAALTLAGLPTDRFLFEGFLPPKSEARKHSLEKLKNIDATLVFLERGSRVPAVIKQCAEILGDREIAVVREITKSYEEVKKDIAQNLIAYYAENPEPRGEVVLVVASPVTSQVSTGEIDQMLVKIMQETGLKDAVAIVAEQLDLPKKQVYSRALELKNE